MSALGLSVRRPSVASSTTSAMTAPTMATPDEDVPPSILLNAHQGSGSGSGSRARATSTNSYYANSSTSSLGNGRPSVPGWREHSSFAGSASSLHTGSYSQASSPRSQSTRVSFAPLPEIPNELRRHNSIALGVVARRDLLQGGQTSRPRGKQDCQVVYMSDDEWEDYQRQYRESAGVVDLGQVARSGAKRLWRIVRSNSSSKSSDQSSSQPLSPPPQKAFWRPRGSSPAPTTRSSSFSSYSLSSSPMLLPAHSSGASPSLENELHTVPEEDRAAVASTGGENRMRSPPPMVRRLLEDDDVVEDGEEEDDEDDDEDDDDNAVEILESTAPVRVESPVHEIPSRVATPRPRRNSSGLHPEPLHPHAARDAAVIGYNEAVHIR